jgi:hypothetical protein
MPRPGKPISVTVCDRMEAVGVAFIPIVNKPINWTI